MCNYSGQAGSRVRAGHEIMGLEGLAPADWGDPPATGCVLDGPVGRRICVR